MIWAAYRTLLMHQIKRVHSNFRSKGQRKDNPDETTETLDEGHYWPQTMAEAERHRD